MGATTAKVGSHATHGMVKRESERTIEVVCGGSDAMSDGAPCTVSMSIAAG